jgi:hypothetical protein
MTKSALIAIAAALLLGGTSLASAKNRGAGGAHSTFELISRFASRQQSAPSG